MDIWGRLAMANRMTFPLAMRARTGVCGVLEVGAPVPFRPCLAVRIWHARMLPYACMPLAVRGVARSVVLSLANVWACERRLGC